MNSSNIVYSAESASGVRVVKCGEVAQELDVEKVDVNYLCGSDRPASEEEARQNLVEKIKEVKSGTCKESTSREKVTGSGRPAQEVPHSVNRKNRNRIRRSLLRQNYWTSQQPGLSKETRSKRLEELQHQLSKYPPRPYTTKSWRSWPRSKPSKKKKNAKRAKVKDSLAGGYCRRCIGSPNVYRPSAWSVKHFCKPGSRI